MERASRFDHLLSWRCVKATFIRKWKCDASVTLWVSSGYWAFTRDFGGAEIIFGGKKSNFFTTTTAIALKQGRGLKGSTVVWGPVQNRGEERSVRFEGWKILLLQSQGSTQIPITILAPLSGWSGWQAEMSLNYHLALFFKLGTLSLFNFQKIAMRTLLFIYFVVGGTQGHDLANAILLSDWITAQVQGCLMPKPGFSLCDTQVLTCKANKSWHKGLLHFLSLLDVPLLVVLRVLQAASPWCLVVKTPLQQQGIVLSLAGNWILRNR